MNDHHDRMAARVAARHLGVRVGFNKYNPIELLSQLVAVLEQEGLDDAVQAVKRVTPVVNREWMRRERRASVRDGAASADDRYKVHLRDVQRSMSSVHRLLDRHVREQAKRPTDWGYVGDMEHVADLLADVEGFLSS